MAMIETCDENPVVAPQSLTNKMALNFPSNPNVVNKMG